MSAVGYALFTSCRSALLTRCGSALLASFHQDHPSVGPHVHSGFWLELCSLPGVAVLRVRQSRPASAVHTVFCSVVPWFVKDLRCSLAVVMALHEPLAVVMLAMALHGSPASLSDELFARPRADPRVLFRTLHVLRVVWCDSAPLAPLPSARCACGGRCFQAGRELRHAVFVATLVRRWEHLVAGASASKVCTLRLSSGFALLCFPRSSTVVLFSPPGLVPKVIPCRRSARVCSEHLRVGRSWFVAMVWLSSLRPPGSRRSSVVATLRSCRRCGCVPRGQRALLDADMLELIDRSACLVEPVSVESCAPPPVLVLSPAASTSSAASGRCSRMSFPRGLVEGLLLPGLLTPSCCCRFTATLAPG